MRKRSANYNVIGFEIFVVVFEYPLKFIQKFVLTIGLYGIRKVKHSRPQLQFGEGERTILVLRPPGARSRCGRTKRHSIKKMSKI